MGGDYDELVETMNLMASVGAVAVPTEPVGEGASWTTTLDWNLDGTATIPVSVDVELVSVEGTAYEIAFDLDLDAAEAFPLDGGESATGTLTASGSITGDIADPLAWTSTGEGTVDITFEGLSEEDPTVTVATTVSIERTSTPT